MRMLTILDCISSKCCSSPFTTSLYVSSFFFLISPWNHKDRSLCSASLFIIISWRKARQVTSDSRARQDASKLPKSQGPAKGQGAYEPARSGDFREEAGQCTQRDFQICWDCCNPSRPCLPVGRTMDGRKFPEYAPCKSLRVRWGNNWF